MREAISDFCKQIIYKYIPLKSSLYFRLFEEIYNSDPQFFPDVKRLEDGKNFLFFNFKSPFLAGYQSKEIALINSYQLVIFWLPGVSARAKGYVSSGQYSVKLKGYMLGCPLILEFLKKDNKIQNFVFKSIGKNDKTKKLKGCYLSYKGIEHELKSQIMFWVESKNVLTKKHLAKPVMSDEIYQSILAFPDKDISSSILLRKDT